MNVQKPPLCESEVIELLGSRGATEETLDRFIECIYRYYHESGRGYLPWRLTNDPYKILVSEIMLQQTQVPRVLEKYRQWLDTFPDFHALANAPLSEVLELWQGLGYNRRAVALHNTAKAVMDNYGGTLPSDIDALKSLPGIGPATAAALSAFVFNHAIPYIETNIRTVFIHFFFNDGEGIKDAELMPLIEKTLDYENPREWYYALMDYGVMLKKAHPNPSRRSAHHTRQSPYEGSNRQLRANALRAVLTAEQATPEMVAERLGIDADRAEKALLELEKDGFLREDGGQYSIAGA